MRHYESGWLVGYNERQRSMGQANTRFAPGDLRLPSGGVFLCLDLPSWHASTRKIRRHHNHIPKARFLSRI